MHTTAATVTRAIEQLLLQAPFYAHVLVALSRRIEERDAETLSLQWRREGFELVINPAYWDQLTVAQQRSALQHEVLHLVFQHPFRLRDFEQALFFQVAADLAVNQWLDQEQLPADFIIKSQFPELVLTGNLSLDDICDQLMKAWQHPDLYPESVAMLRRLAEKDQPAIDRHRWWVAVKPETRTSFDTLMRFCAAACSPEASATLPPMMQRALAVWQNINKPTVDWRRALRLACQGSRQTRLSDTLKRPSRRFGTLPGLKIRRKQRIFVAVDTSGSISASALRLFFSEIHQLWRTGVVVTVIECDAAIGRIYTYEGRTPERVAGGGGTSFVPPLAYANQHRPDLMIYFTDGEGAAPHLALRYPLLWVLAPDSRVNINVLPGRKIHMTT